MKDQLSKQWLPTYSKQHQLVLWSPRNTLFAFFIGINDVGNTYWDSNRTIVDRIFNEYADFVEQVLLITVPWTYTELTEII